MLGCSQCRFGGPDLDNSGIARLARSRRSSRENGTSQPILRDCATDAQQNRCCSFSVRSCIVTAAGSSPSRPKVGGQCTVVATLPSAHTIHPNRRSPTACAHQRGRAAAIIAAQPRWGAVAASTSQLEARTAGNCRVRGKWAARRECPRQIQTHLWPLSCCRRRADWARST